MSKRSKKSTAVDSTLPPLTSNADAEVSHDAVAAAQLAIKRRIFASDVPDTIHAFRGRFDKAKKTVVSLLRSSIVGGESNSLLVIGPRGCGKSLLIKESIRELGTDDEVCSQGCILIHLNGYLHSDDGIAIKEFARQLGVASQPESWRPRGKVSAAPHITKAQASDAVIDALRSGDATYSQCIVVVLDEFDLFAHASKQTLLYTLFDISQAGHTPLVVVGLTCRLDSMTLLEKRVLSRFSSRQIHLFPEQDFEDYMLMVRETLSLPPTFEHIRFRDAWNAHVAGLVQSDIVKRELSALHDVTKDIRALFNVLALPVCRLSVERPFIQASDFFDAYVSQSMDSKVAIALSLSVLEVCLLIASHKVSQVVYPDTFNFEQVFDCYKAFCLDPNNKGVDFYSKPIAYKSFEHLLSLELLTPAGVSRRAETSTFQHARMMMSRLQVVDVVDRYPAIPPHIRAWAKVQS